MSPGLDPYPASTPCNVKPITKLHTTMAFVLIFGFLPALFHYPMTGTLLFFVTCFESGYFNERQFSSC